MVFGRVIVCCVREKKGGLLLDEIVGCLYGIWPGHLHGARSCVVVVLVARAQPDSLDQRPAVPGRGPLSRFTVPLSERRIFMISPMIITVCVNTIYTDHTQLARDILGRDMWEEDNQHT